jgi:hypothetical protein
MTMPLFSIKETHFIHSYLCQSLHQKTHMILPTDSSIPNKVSMLNLFHVTLLMKVFNAFFILFLLNSFAKYCLASTNTKYHEIFCDLFCHCFLISIKEYILMHFEANHLKNHYWRDVIVIKFTFFTNFVFSISYNHFTPILSNT